MGRATGQNDTATGRIRLQLIAVELIAETDVENAGHDCVDLVLRVSVRHQLHAGRHFDPDHVGARALKAERLDQTDNSASVPILSLTAKCIISCSDLQFHCESSHPCY